MRERLSYLELFDRQQIGLILDSFAAGRSAQLLADLEASIEDSLRSLRRFLADGQLADVSRRAHRLAGAALSFGLPALHRAAQELQSAIDRGDATLEKRLVETEQTADAALQAVVLLRRHLRGDASLRMADGQITASR